MTDDHVNEETGEITSVAVVEHQPQIMLAENPVESFKMMRELVQAVASSCKGPAFSANIQGKNYPTVQWWTTVGASLGMFPYEVRSEKIEDDAGKMGYESFVEVRRNGVAITSASAICSRSERTWASRDEYAIKSMATTRATAKAYRLGLSFLAVLSGLEATPAEEMPRDASPPPGAHNGPRRTRADWDTDEYREANEVLSHMFTSADEKSQYVSDILGKPEPITHPREVTADEWIRVKESAVGDLAMNNGEEDARMQSEADAVLGRDS